MQGYGIEEDQFDAFVKISNNFYHVTTLHRHLELIDDCCILINTEWKRSHVARIRSISGSSDNFPTSMVLLEGFSKFKVIGHCKLTKISHSYPVVFIDTVVIHPHFRGKGFGKMLMKKTELYAKSKGIEWIYLTTRGQELFYEKLGYSTCQPISIFGGQFKYDVDDDSDIHTGAGSQVGSDDSDKQISVVNSPEGNLKQFSENNFRSSPLIPPPPPPMPTFRSTGINLNSKKTFMKKKVL